MCMCKLSLTYLRSLLTFFISRIGDQTDEALFAAAA